MPVLKTEVVEFPSIANDMICIYIHDDFFIGSNFQYEIRDKEEKIFRKGHFLGTRVQIRIAHLKDGHYFFCLHFGETDSYTFCFEKISDTTESRLRDSW